MCICLTRQNLANYLMCITIVFIDIIITCGRSRVYRLFLLASSSRVAGLVFTDCFYWHHHVWQVSCSHIVFIGIIITCGRSRVHRLFLLASSSRVAGLVFTNCFYWHHHHVWQVSCLQSGCHTFT